MGEAWDGEKVHWGVLLPDPDKMPMGDFTIHHIRTFLADQFSSIFAVIWSILNLESLLAAVIAAGESCMVSRPGAMDAPPGWCPGGLMMTALLPDCGLDFSY